MIYNVFAVRDVKTGYLTPTVDQNKQSAIRNFEHAVMNTNGLFFSHAEDYSLYVIGEYNTDTGVISQVEKELLVEASDIKLKLGE